MWAKAIDLSAEGAYESSGVSRDWDFCPIGGTIEVFLAIDTQEG
jgi:hypothetical protein